MFANLFHKLLRKSRVFLLWNFSVFGRRTNIVMFHLGRCGSTALAHHLQNNPYITWAGEIIELEAEKNTALKKINVFATNSFRKYSGIEIKPFHLRNCQISPQEFMDFLEKKYFTTIIFLTRKNLLRMIIFNNVSSKTKVWHIQDAHDQKLHQIHLNPEAVTVRGKTSSLLATLEQIEKDISEFEELLQDYKILRLYYEDDVFSSPTIGYRKICAFAGIPFVENSISLVKTNPYPIKEILINFSEVEATLLDTRFEWMLYESN